MARVRRIWAVILIAALLLPGFDALSEATSLETEAAVQEMEFLIGGEDAAGETEASQAEAGETGASQAEVGETGASQVEAEVPESESFDLSDIFGGQIEEQEEPEAVELPEGDEQAEGSAKSGKLMDVDAPETAAVNASVSFQVWTTDDIKVVAMYAENGVKVKSWDSSYSTPKINNTLMWDLHYAFSQAGDRTLTFKAATSESALNGTDSVYVKDIRVVTVPAVSSVSVASTTIAVGAQQTFTAKTPSEAAYLRMYAEDGTAIATWSTNGNSSVSGSVRTWTVKLPINAAGSRTMTFKASADGKTFGAGKSVTFTVTPPAVTSATVALNTITAGAQQTFTVKTPSTAKHLRMYAENNTIAGDWEASSSNSSVSSGVRTWTLKQAINTAGSRTLTFKASAEGKVFDNGMSVSFTVIPAPSLTITSLTVSPTTLEVGSQATFTAKTSDGVKFLRMFAESGTAIATWNADGNSSVSGSVRTWTVQMNINTAGSRTMTFKASVDGKTFGDGKTVTFTVTAPAVTSATVSVNPIDAGVQQTFTVRTPSTAKYLRMYAENGTTIVGTWEVSSCTNTVSSGVRTWTLKQAINTAGDRTLTFKASADGKIFGNGKSVSFKVNPVTSLIITDLTVTPTTLEVGSQATFTAKTADGVKYLRMIAESGTVIATWPADGSSSVSGGVRTWTEKLPINAAGSRTMTFKASVDSKTWGAGKLVSFTVTAPAVTSATAALNPMTAGEEQTFTVKTPVTAKYLKMFAEDGSAVGSWEASGNSAASNGVRTWTVKQVINTEGERQMTFKASAEGNVFGDSKIVLFTVKPLTSVPVNSVTVASSTIAAGAQQTFTVKTHVAAKYLRMFAEDGTPIRTWSNGDLSTVSGSERTWTVTQAINAAGSRTMTFKASADGNAWGTYKKATFTVTPPPVLSVTVALTTIGAGTEQTFTVVTPKVAKRLKMLDENGKDIASWPENNNSTVSGTTRTWTVKLTINAPGSRTLTFKASAEDKLFGTGWSTSFTVGQPDVTSVTVALNPMEAGAQQTFTAKTPLCATSLRMCAEDGTVIATWSSDEKSTVSGSIRIWTVKLAINAAGSRTMNFKASADGKTFGKDKPVTFTVKQPSVSLATVTAGTIEAGVKQTFTARTSMAAKYLRMYAEDGTPIATWSDDKSTVSGTTRVWTVDMVINAPGDRKMTFKASSEGKNFGTGYEVSFTVTQPSVSSVKATPGTIPAGAQETFTAQTTAAAKYLRMYAENNSTPIATWSSDEKSTVSGSTRTWTVGLAINTPGNRKMTFKASTDNKSFGAGHEVSFTVNQPVVWNAKVAKTSIGAGDTQTFTVQTHSCAAHLRMIAENNTILGTWSASNSNISSVSGTTRTWTVNLPINGMGDRRISFKASTNGSEYGTGATVSFKVGQPSVQSASASPNKIDAGQKTTITAVTVSAANYLRVFAEDGTAVQTWKADGKSTVSGNTRTWKVELQLNGEGNRNLTLKASTNGSEYGTEYTVSVIVGSPVKYRALLIGQKSIEDTKQGERNESDVNEMVNILNSVTGPEGGKYTITKRIDRSANQVKNDISSTFSAADDDDVSLFFIATEGDYTSEGAAAGALDMVNSGRLTLKELADALKNVRGKVIVFVEASGSGAGVYIKGGSQSNEVMAKARAAAKAFDEVVIRAFAEADPGMPTDGVNPKTGEFLVTNKFYVLTSSGYMKENWGFDDQEINMFLGWLKEAIYGENGTGNMLADNNHDGITTLNELYNYVYPRGKEGRTVKKEKYSQEVQVYPSNSSYPLFKR